MSDYTYLQSLADRCREHGKALVLEDDEEYKPDSPLDFRGIRVVRILGTINPNHDNVGVLLGGIDTTQVHSPRWDVEVRRWRRGGYDFSDDSIAIKICGCTEGTATLRTAGCGIGVQLYSDNRRSPVSYMHFTHLRHAWEMVCLEFRTLSKGWINQCQHYGGHLEGKRQGNLRTRSIIELNTKESGGYGAHGHLFTGTSFEGDSEALVRCSPDATDTVKLMDTRIECRVSGDSRAIVYGESSEVAFHALTATRHPLMNLNGVEVQQFNEPTSDDG